MTPPVGSLASVVGSTLGSAAWGRVSGGRMTMAEQCRFALQTVVAQLRLQWRGYVAVSDDTRRRWRRMDPDHIELPDTPTCRACPGVGAAVRDGLALPAQPADMGVGSAARSEGGPEAGHPGTGRFLPAARCCVTAERPAASRPALRLLCDWRWPERVPASARSRVGSEPGPYCGGRDLPPHEPACPAGRRYRGALAPTGSGNGCRRGADDRDRRRVETGRAGPLPTHGLRATDVRGHATAGRTRSGYTHATALANGLRACNPPICMAGVTAPLLCPWSGARARSN
jgi:hypothetical protein